MDFLFSIITDCRGRNHTQGNDIFEIEKSLIQSINFPKIVDTGRLHLIFVFWLYFQLACANERLHDVADMSADAGRKVYDAYLYIPNTAVKISGEVIVSAKEFVFAFTNVSYRKKELLEKQSRIINISEINLHFEASIVLRYSTELISSHITGS